MVDLHAEQSAHAVQCGRSMDIQVGVHSARDKARAFYDGQGHPFLSKFGQGVARTSRDGATVNPAWANRPDHHPSGTGRAVVAAEITVDNACQDNRSVNRPNKSDRELGSSPTVSTIHEPLVDPDQATLIFTGTTGMVRDR